MIVYPLSCDHGHEFEGWFASSEAFEGQKDTGQLQCPSCSSVEVHKLPSAPYVHGAQAAKPPAAAKRRGEALAALRTFILTHTDDVGRDFAEVARRIHYQEEEARSIRGQVTAEEAQELQEEGVEAFAISPEVIPPADGIH